MARTIFVITLWPSWRWKTFVRSLNSFKKVSLKVTANRFLPSLTSKEKLPLLKSAFAFTSPSYSIWANLTGLSSFPPTTTPLIVITALLQTPQPQYFVLESLNSATFPQAIFNSSTFETPQQNVLSLQAFELSESFWRQGTDGHSPTSTTLFVVPFCTQFGGSFKCFVRGVGSQNASSVSVRSKSVNELKLINKCFVLWK